VPTTHHVMKRIPRRATRVRLADPNLPTTTTASPFGGPQCRFCDHDVYDRPRRVFFKYGVRHYCCSECLAEILNAPPQSYPA